MDEDAGLVDEMAGEMDELAEQMDQDGFQNGNGLEFRNSIREFYWVFCNKNKNTSYW